MVKFTIKQARKYSEISEIEMAEILGVCRETYRKIEQNPNICKKEQWEKISQKTGIPLNLFYKT